MCADATPTGYRPARFQARVRRCRARHLKRSGWSPRGWTRFLAATLRQSTADALLQKRAFAEVSIAHLILGVAVRKPRPVVSWLLAATHLGLLGDAPRGLGWPNRVSLLRANLPALLPDAPAVGILALASDYLDGRLTRALPDQTAFGAYCDALADVAFWAWFAARREPNTMLRLMALLASLAPPLAVTAAYFIRGRSLDYPRPLLRRNLQVALQAVLALRDLRRSMPCVHWDGTEGAFSMAAVTANFARYSTAEYARRYSVTRREVCSAVTLEVCTTATCDGALRVRCRRRSVRRHATS